jgi:hypothetical protein
MRATKRRIACPTAETLFVFISGQDVAPQVSQRVRAHLVQCLRCREDAETLQRFIQQELTLEIAVAYQDVTTLWT